MLLDTIKVLCDSHNISIWKLEKSLSFANATIRRWNSNSPGIDKVKSVADYFGVSVDYLLGCDKSCHSGDSKIIASTYEKLPDEQKAVVKALLQSMSN